MEMLLVFLKEKFAGDERRGRSRRRVDETCTVIQSILKMWCVSEKNQLKVDLIVLRTKCLKLELKSVPKNSSKTHTINQTIITVPPTHSYTSAHALLINRFIIWPIHVQLWPVGHRFIKQTICNKKESKQQKNQRYNFSTVQPFCIIQNDGGGDQQQWCIHLRVPFVDDNQVRGSLVTRSDGWNRHQHTTTHWRLTRGTASWSVWLNNVVHFSFEVTSQRSVTIEMTHTLNESLTS